MDDRPIELPGVRVTAMRSRGSRPGGRLYWRARTTGTRKTAWTGWGTREEATLEVADQIRMGLPGARLVRADVRTVTDLLDRWEDAQIRRQDAGEIAEQTLGNYRCQVGHWRGSIGEVLVARLTRALVEDTLTTWRRVDGVSARSCQLATAVIRMAWRWGIERGHAPPLDLGRLRGARVRQDEYVNNAATPTRAQIVAVLEHVDDRRVDRLLRLLAQTGARIGELAAAQVSDWRPLEGVLVLHGRDPARGRRGKRRPRSFEVLPELRALLEDLVGDRREGPLVEGLPLCPSNLVRVVLGRACAAAGVPAFTSHGVRRSIAMELLDHTDPKTVSEITGHSVAVLLEHYVRPDAARVRDVLARARLGLEGWGTVVELRSATGHTDRAQPTEDDADH